MAGTLEFALNMEEAGFVGAAAAGVASLRNIEMAVAKTNTGMADLTRTASGLVVPINALNYASGPTATMFLQGTQIIPQLAQRFENLTRSTSAQANSLTQLGQGTKSVTSSLKAMEGVFLIFGGQVAPQLTTGILTVTTGLNALKATATATGMSLASIGVAGLGVVGIMATLSAAVDLARAKLAEGQSESDLRATLLLQAESMRRQIRDLFGKDKLGKEEAISLQVQLDKNTIPELEQALLNVRKRVREVMGPALNLKAIDTIEGIERRTKADSLKGQDRVTAELDIAVIDFTNQIWDVGLAAGRTKDELGKLINDFATNLRPRLEEQFLPKTASGEKTSDPLRAPQTTSIERMGFVFNSGLNRGGNDFSRDTALNTRKTYEAVKALTDKVGGTTSNSFANQ